MFRECTYDETKDLQPVDKIGWIDVADAVKNGYVPASIESDDMVYNEIEDPASIMHNASDVFELYRQADYIKSYPTGNDEAKPQSQTE